MQNARRRLAGFLAAIIGIVALVTIVIGGCRPVLAQKPVAGEEEQQALDNSIIYAEVLLKGFDGCPVELYVNDIPVARAGGEIQPFASVPVPEFIIDGENSLTLVICSGPTPSSAVNSGDCEWGPKADPKMEAVARIARLADGVMAEPGEGETLIELQWNGEDGDSLPTVVTVTGDLGKQFGPWKWQSADELTLDEATRKSATAFIGTIKVAYEKCDPEPIIACAKIKHSEAERAYPAYEKGFFEPMIREKLTGMKDAPEWKPRNLPLDQYDLRLVAGGRMIEAIAKDWRPIIRMDNDDYCFRMMFGRINGQWQIMR
jgi:hypothetical protein